MREAPRLEGWEHEDGGDLQCKDEVGGGGESEVVFDTESDAGAATLGDVECDDECPPPVGIEDCAQI